MSASKNLWLFWLPCFLSGTGLAYVFEEYSDSYYNEISEGDQQEAKTTSDPCQTREQTRWDRMFTMLENSHMMQNMLLQYTEGLGKVLQDEIRKLSAVDSNACFRALEDTCKDIDQQVNLKLDQALAHLREMADKNQAQNNLTLQQLVEMTEDQASHLVKLESACTQGPELLQVARKHFPDYTKDQGTNTGYGGKLERDLKATAANLHRVHLQMALFQRTAVHRYIPSGCEMALLFPVRSKHSFAEVKPSMSFALSSLSICLWAKASQVLNRTVLFSYGTTSRPRELQLLLAHDSVLFIVGEMLRMEAHNVVSDRQWGHYCGMWSSEQGLASLWANGEMVSSISGVADRHHLRKGGSILLGQEMMPAGTLQDLNPLVGFTGKMTAVNVWDHVLEADSIKKNANAHGACENQGNVIGWGINEVIPHGSVQYIN